MTENNMVRTIEEVTAVLEEQELTKEELMTFLRQVVEIRAFEDNIANLLEQGRAQGRFPLICRARSRGCRRGGSIA